MSPAKLNGATTDLGRTTTDKSCGTGTNRMPVHNSDFWIVGPIKRPVSDQILIRIGFHPVIGNRSEILKRYPPISISVGRPHPGCCGCHPSFHNIQQILHRHPIRTIEIPLRRSFPGQPGISATVPAHPPDIRSPVAGFSHKVPARCCECRTGLHFQGRLVIPPPCRLSTKGHIPKTGTDCSRFIVSNQTPADRMSKWESRSARRITELNNTGCVVSNQSTRISVVHFYGARRIAISKSA